MEAMRCRDEEGDTQTSYKCEECGEIFVGEDYTTHDDVIKIDDIISVGYNNYVLYNNYEKDCVVFQCECGCYVDEEPDVGELWQCGSCERVYASKQEAINCQN